MLKRILYKPTNEIFYGSVDNNFINLPICEYTEIPDDNKYYKYENGCIVEDKAKQNVLHNFKIIQQIEEIENKQQRAIREAILSGDKTFLEKYDKQIIELRNKLIT